MKKGFYIFLVLTAVLVFALISRTASAEKIVLQVQSCFPLKLQGLGTTIGYVADNIGVASNGEVVMKVYEPGKLVPAFEIMDAVSKGSINAGFATATYWAGKAGPAAPLFGAIPFGPEYLEYAAWFYKGNGMKLYQEFYDKAGFNVKVLLLGILAPECSGWFRKPINSPEDIKGLRIRFMGLGGKVMQKLGASVSLLPLGETFPALEKGALDATEVCTPAVDKGLGLYKIAKHNYYPGWHQPATNMELLINKETWNKMTEAQKRITEVMCAAGTFDCMTTCEFSQGEVVKEFIEKHGVTVHYWSKEFLELFHKTWNEVLEEEKKDPFFKKVWDDLEAFRETYKYWVSMGYLPRPQPPKRK